MAFLRQTAYTLENAFPSLRVWKYLLLLWWRNVVIKSVV